MAWGSVAAAEAYNEANPDPLTEPVPASFAPVDAIEADEAGFVQASKRKRSPSPPRPPSGDDLARAEAGSSAGEQPGVGSSEGQFPICPLESQSICCSCSLENPTALRIGCQGCYHLVCTSCAALRGTVGHHWCPHCPEEEEMAVIRLQQNRPARRPTEGVTSGVEATTSLRRPLQVRMQARTTTVADGNPRPSQANAGASTSQTATMLEEEMAEEEALEIDEMITLPPDEVFNIATWRAELEEEESEEESLMQQSSMRCKKMCSLGPCTERCERREDHREADDCACLEHESTTDMVRFSVAVRSLAGAEQVAGLSESEVALRATSVLKKIAEEIRKEKETRSSSSSSLLQRSFKIQQGRSSSS